MTSDLWVPVEVGKEIERVRQETGGSAEFDQALVTVLSEYGIGLADIELARDDAGWMKLGMGDSTAIPADSREYSVRRARTYFDHDPLSGQAVGTPGGAVAH